MEEGGVPQSKTLKSKLNKRVVKWNIIYLIIISIKIVRVSSKRHCWDGNSQVECEVNSDTEYMTKGHIGQGSS